MIHSGSRNLGSKVADYYNKLAIKLNEKWFSSIPKEWELAFLPIDTQEAHDYSNEMNYCIEFALANRKLMMDRIINIFKYETQYKINLTININHNYARWENHYGENVIVHRKGATSAKLGEIGIIPGSQGSHSYIIKGLGNKESFESCSHGAGRSMGRNEATKKLNLENEIKILEDQGIIHSIRSIKDLDEATSSYKNIDTVMKNQKDLVEILVELQPIAVIKG
jgi:tRNA-splicing ligase RtcB (3'-phosphate/5'-hydroxy nucleic acid ligase)